MRRGGEPGGEAEPAGPPEGSSRKRVFPVGGTPKCRTNIFEVKQAAGRAPRSGSL